MYEYSYIKYPFNYAPRYLLLKKKKKTIHLIKVKQKRNTKIQK